MTMPKPSQAHGTLDDLRRLDTLRSSTRDRILTQEILDRRARNGCMFDRAAKPTHWMPLPDDNSALDKLPGGGA